MTDSPFADLLLPGESVIAQLAGEGRPVDRGHGVERTWWHVALTPERVLVIRMKPAADPRLWEVAARTVAPRANVRIAHYPRTATDTACLSLDGTGDRIVFVDADRPPVAPQVRAFLAAWGAPVPGGESVSQGEIDLYAGDTTGQKTFLYVAVALLAAFVLCCGCLGLAGVLRMVLAGVFYA